MADDPDPPAEGVSHFFDYNIDLKTKTMYLGDSQETEDEHGEINADVAAKVIKGLHILDHVESPGRITILLNTRGGDEIQGLAIYDAIKACQHETVIKVLGQCMSVGVWVLQAGAKRVLSPNCLLMIHKGVLGFSPEHPEVVMKWIKQYEKSEKFMEDILLTRICQKRPDFTRERLQELLRFDTIFTPQEAIDLGLADAIG